MSQYGNCEDEILEEVKFFAFGEHGEDGFQPFIAGFGFFGGLESPDNGITIGFIESVEKSFSFLIFGKCIEKIFRDCSFTGRVVGRFPPSVFLGFNDLFQTTGFHFPAFDKTFNMIDISF